MLGGVLDIQYRWRHEDGAASELGRDDAGIILMPQIFMKLPWFDKKAARG